MSSTNGSTLSPNASGSVMHCAAQALSKNPTANIYIYPGVVLGVVIMLLNLLVIVAVIKNKNLHKPAFYYVSSLAVADFIAGLTTMYSFIRSFLNQDAVLREELEIKQGIFITSISASILTLLLISLNRYFVIVHPFHYRARMNNVIVAVAITTVWLYSLVLGSLPIAGWNAQHGDCSAIIPGLSRTYVFVASLHVVVVLLVILFLYLWIFIKVKESSNKFKKSTRSSEEKAHVKVAKTLFIVTAAFAVCWLPYMMIGILDMARSIKLAKYTPFFAILAVLNSGLNPIIYACRDERMRKTFKGILCPSPCCNRPRGHGELVSSNAHSKTTCLTLCLPSATDRTVGIPYEKKSENPEQEISTENKEVADEETAKSPS